MQARFDHWLKGIDLGVDKDPAMRLWLMDDARASSHMTDRPGKWLGFPSWPSPAIRQQKLHLRDHGLTGSKPAQPGAPRAICSPLTTGLQGQEWCPYGQGRISAEGARDQRADDGGSLCYDTEPLTEEMALMGRARLTLRIAADRPQAMVAARLTSVSPNGTSAFVTYAIFNLSHRESQEFPRALTPGIFETVHLVMKPIGQMIPKGNRLRLAISSSYWPMAWPSPELTTLTIDPAGSLLDLPLVGDTSNLPAVAFEPAVMAEAGPVTEKSPGRQLRHIETDVAAERTTLTAFSDDGVYVLDEIGTEVTAVRKKVYAIAGNDPNTCTTTVTCRESFARAGWRVHVDSETSATCTRDSYRVTGWFKAYDGDQLFMAREYDETIPRDFQ